MLLYVCVYYGERAVTFRGRCEVDPGNSVVCDNHACEKVLELATLMAFKHSVDPGTWKCRARDVGMATIFHSQPTEEK